MQNSWHIRQKYLGPWHPKNAPNLWYVALSSALGETHGFNCVCFNFVERTKQYIYIKYSLPRYLFELDVRKYHTCIINCYVYYNIHVYNFKKYAQTYKFVKLKHNCSFIETAGNVCTTVNKVIKMETQDGSKLDLLNLNRILPLCDKHMHKSKLPTHSDVLFSYLGHREDM